MRAGETLDGSKHNYTITFPAGQLPPVNSFWSVTMYDGKSQLLIKNPIDRYLINSPMLPAMKKNADGSLTLYIQKDSPGKAKEANWLPAPDGPIYLVMRLYWPKDDAAFDPAARRRHVEAAGDPGREANDGPRGRRPGKTRQVGLRAMKAPPDSAAQMGSPILTKRRVSPAKGSRHPSAGSLERHRDRRR